MLSNWTNPGNICQGEPLIPYQIHDCHHTASLAPPKRRMLHNTCKQVVSPCVCFMSLPNFKSMASQHGFRFLLGGIGGASLVAIISFHQRLWQDHLRVELLELIQCLPQSFHLLCAIRWIVVCYSDTTLICKDLLVYLLHPVCRIWIIWRMNRYWSDPSSQLWVCLMTSYAPFNLPWFVFVFVG
jgi:hypothetical protein